MGDSNADVLDATHQIFVLSFDLVETEFEALPKQLDSALASPAIQAAIEKTLLDFLRTTPSSDAGIMSSAEAAKLMTALDKRVSDPLSKQTIDKIKATPEFKRLEKSISAFEQAAKSTALGAWIDRNQNILYVVGAGLAVGTASVLYITKTSGPTVNLALSGLQGIKLDVLKIGRLKIQSSLWDFQPDARIFGARIFSTVDLEKVKVDLKFGVLAEGSTIQQVEGSAVVKSGPINLTLSGADNFQKREVNLGFNATYDNNKFNIGLGAAYQDDVVTGTATAGYKTRIGTVGAKFDAGGQKGGGTKFDALLTLTIPVR